MLYNFNYTDGDFPHLSTAVTHLKPGERRVILGFNCFPAGPVAECTRRAPEHSDAFKRTVKLFQTVSSLYSTNGKDDAPDSKYSSNKNKSNIPITSIGGDTDITNNSSTTNIKTSELVKTSSSRVVPSNKSKLTLEDIKKNPFLTKLIIKAAKSYGNKSTDK